MTTGDDVFRRGAARPIGELIGRIVRQHERARPEEGDLLSREWAKAAGADTAARTRLLGVKRGTLRVAVGSSSLRHELEVFRKAPLLQALRDSAPELRIVGIRFELERR